MAKKKPEVKDETGDNTLYAVTSLSHETKCKTLEEAQVAAQNLATANPGVEYHVLQSLSSVTCSGDEEETTGKKEEEAA